MMTSSASSSSIVISFVGRFFSPSLSPFSAASPPMFCRRGFFSTSHHFFSLLPSSSSSVQGASPQLSSSPFHRLIHKRQLGNAARGPAGQFDVKKHFSYACSFFTNPAVSYDGFKQQCESLRLFVFFGVVSLLSLDFLIRPPRSSYWRQWSPFRWPSHLWKQFSSGQGGRDSSLSSVFGSISTTQKNGIHEPTSEGWETYRTIMYKNM